MNCWLKWCRKWRNHRRWTRIWSYSTSKKWAHKSSNLFTRCVNCLLRREWNASSDSAEFCRTSLCLKCAWIPSPRGKPTQPRLLIISATRPPVLYSWSSSYSWLTKPPSVSPSTSAASSARLSGFKLPRIRLKSEALRTCCAGWSTTTKLLEWLRLAAAKNTANIANSSSIKSPRA